MSQASDERYQIEEQIGSGGAARVYRALDRVLQRPVAVKVLNEQVDPRLKERFQAEAQSVARLNHPNIANVYDVGERGSSPYIVMEHVEGTNLKRLIRERGALPPAEAVRIVSQVGSALEYAHQQGLVHCDVKPHNILITPDGRAKLVDFGIAQAQVDRNRDRSEQVFGTPLYMAPEQAAGQQVSPRTDVYGLGLVLWEALTGKAPERKGEGKPVILNAGVGKLPRALATVIRRATEPSPASRYASVADMLHELESWESARPAVSQQTTVAVPAAPPAGTRREAPVVRRRDRPAAPRWFSFLPALALLLLLFGLLVTYAAPRLLASGRDTLSGLFGAPPASASVEVPRLVGLKLPAARQLAQDRGLKVTAEFQQRNDRPSGTVLSQDPAEGARVRSGDTVALTVAGSAQQSGQTAPPSPTPVLAPVRGRWTVQLSAVDQPVRVELTQDGKTSKATMQPGEYRELRAVASFRVWGDPADQLLVTVDGKQLGTLKQAAEKLCGCSIGSSYAFITYGSGGAEKGNTDTGKGKGKGRGD